MGSNFHTPWDTNVLFKPTSMNPVPSDLDRAVSYLKNVFLHCDGVIIYTKSTGTLAWNNTIRIFFIRADGQTIQNTISAGSIALSDTEFAYVDLNETNNTVLTVSKAAVSTGVASNFKAFNRLVLGYRNAASDEYFPVYLQLTEIKAYGSADIVGKVKNLVIVRNVTNPTYQVDIDADVVVVQDAAGKTRRLTGINLTADITASGANGLDTGSEAGDTWYYIFVIAKPDNTTASLLSVSSTSPSLPSGYTYFGLVGAVRNDGSSNFLAFYQLDERVEIITVEVVSAGTAETPTSIDLTGVIPPGICKSCHGDGYPSLTGTSTYGQLYIFAYDGTNELGRTLIGNSVASPNVVSGFWEVVVKADEIYYKGNYDDTGSSKVFVTGYSLKL